MSRTSCANDADFSWVRQQYLLPFGYRRDVGKIGRNIEVHPEKEHESSGGGVYIVQVMAELPRSHQVAGGALLLCHSPCCGIGDRDDEMLSGLVRLRPKMMRHCTPLIV